MQANILLKTGGLGGVEMVAGEVGVVADGCFGLGNSITKAFLSEASK